MAPTWTELLERNRRVKRFELIKKSAQLLTSFQLVSMRRLTISRSSSSHRLASMSRQLSFVRYLFCQFNMYMTVLTLTLNSRLYWFSSITWNVAWYERRWYWSTINWKYVEVFIFLLLGNRSICYPKLRWQSCRQPRGYYLYRDIYPGESAQGYCHYSSFW